MLHVGGSSLPPFAFIGFVQQRLGPVPAPASLLKQRKNLLENSASLTFQKVLLFFCLKSRILRIKLSVH